MSQTSQAHPRGFLQNFRKDAWWNYPLFTAIVLGAFGVYSLFAALSGFGVAADGFSAENPVFHYTAEGRNYLSPFFSPCLTTQCATAEHGEPWNGWAGDFPRISPAWFVMWMPLGLRATCYYYRKAYYRAFFLSPAACSVDEPRSKYRGETAFPFILQNIHRYFLYLALLFPPFLFYDSFLALKIGGAWGLGLGALIILTNAILLTGFTLGCHALRHAVGGRLDCFSCSGLAKGQHKLWKGVTWFNKHHAKWAWVSLFWVGFTDLYVRGLSLGWWNDPTLFILGGA